MTEEMDAPGLLNAAARLIDRALAKLDTTTVECPCCARLLVANTVHSRVYEQFAETPNKLRNASGLLESTKNAAVVPSRGYQKAVEAREQRISGR